MTESSQSTFQSSKLVLLVNNYTQLYVLCIWAVALTTPKFNPNPNPINQISRKNSACGMHLFQSHKSEAGL